jgi:multisubunit Na+/H+ antiporter MnhG subunit
MIEIIALVILVMHIGKVAERKKQPKVKWQVLTVVGWVLAEAIGVMFGLMFFGTGNLIGLMLLGLVSAVGGYLIVKAQLDKYPDNLDNDIDQIGN